MQIGIPMFFVYLLYRYRVPALARYKKRCHQVSISAVELVRRHRSQLVAN
jgi:hypothetical protein